VRRARFVGALLLLLSAASPAWAELPISVVSLTSPVAPFTDATIQVQTSPGASCSITVLYKSGPSRAKGLAPQTADSRGRVTWIWRVGSNTTPGQWPIAVRCQKGYDSGELKTSFEVR
jgi:micrococcal nuclease